ncbi:unnamed protein product [Strongylus vulgaris]|uniref:Uncharacterized protein n=1 Tax=Strongylus vulgaris TaxID=40348 RepID=A0A3P7KM58_STRVU|nr:unnamed protein product [Strongylus vulgaris]
MLHEVGHQYRLYREERGLHYLLHLGFVEEQQLLGFVEEQQLLLLQLKLQLLRQQRLRRQLQQRQQQPQQQQPQQQQQQRRRRHRRRQPQREEKQLLHLRQPLLLDLGPLLVKEKQRGSQLCRESNQPRRFYQLEIVRLLGSLPPARL